MTVRHLASSFCQVCWVVKDIAATEKFFVERIGIKKFMHFDSLTAEENEGTYLGKPGNWEFKLYIANAGEVQIELVEHVAGDSMFNEFFQEHGNGVQHVAYWLDDSDYDAAARRLESDGYPLIQSLRLPIMRVGYFDTRSTVGVVTELVGANEGGHKFRRDLRDGNF